MKSIKSIKDKCFSVIKKSVKLLPAQKVTADNPNNGNQTDEEKCSNCACAIKSSGGEIICSNSWGCPCDTTQKNNQASTENDSKK